MYKNSNICVTAARSQVTNLDGLPLTDRSLVNYEEYSRYIGQALVKNCISLQATRGCPYKCAYCHKIWPKKHYARSAENLFKEVRMYYDLGVRRFSFVDDIFNLEAANSMKFFELIIKHNLDLHLLFPAGLRGDILTKDYIDLMVEAGTIDFSVSLETASPRLQVLIGKHLNIDRLRENVEYTCKKYPHVILELFAMHGFPTETEEEAMQTLEFIKSLQWLHFPYLAILRIFRNTEVEKIAIRNGISPEAISRSENMAFHELPETLPFDKSFSFNYQAEFLHGYFLSPERLLAVLPHQMKVLTEDEIAQKYNSYLPAKITCLTDILKSAGIPQERLNAEDCLDEAAVWVPDLDAKIKSCFTVKEPEQEAVRVLLLDLSLYYSGEKEILYDCIDAPLGLMSLMSYLQMRLGDKVNGKIAKSRIDFKDDDMLQEMINEFKPHVIGLRTLTIFKDFFHARAAKIKQWQADVPVVAGGPYATCDYERILADTNIDLVVLGEGEITFCELIEIMIESDKKLPGEDVLKDVAGIAFPRGRVGSERKGIQAGAASKEYREVKQGERESFISQFVDDLENE